MKKLVKGFMFLSAVVFFVVCFRDVPRKLLNRIDNANSEDDIVPFDFRDEDIEAELAL